MNACRFCGSPSNGSSILGAPACHDCASDYASGAVSLAELHALAAWIAGAGTLDAIYDQVQP